MSELSDAVDRANQQGSDDIALRARCGLIQRFMDRENAKTIHMILDQAIATGDLLTIEALKALEYVDAAPELMPEQDIEH